MSKIVIATAFLSLSFLAGQQSIIRSYNLLGSTYNSGCLDGVYQVTRSNAHNECLARAANHQAKLALLMVDCNNTESCEYKK